MLTQLGQPRRLGKQSRLFAQFAKTINGGDANIATASDGNGNWYIYFVGSLGGDKCIVDSNKGHRTTNPSAYTIDSFTIPNQSPVEAAHFYQRTKGIFSGPGQSVEIQYNGVSIITLNSSGSGVLEPFVITIDVDIAKPSSEQYWDAIGYNGAGCALMVGGDGANLAVDFSNDVTCDVIVNDTIGSGVEMGDDYSRVWYSVKP